MLGDGSYMMMNSEIATSVMMGKKLTIVVLDNRGFGCINRLQMATGGANFNNLLKDTKHEVMPEIDFAKHAESMGAVARKVGSIAELEAVLREAESDTQTSVHRDRHRSADRDRCGRALVGRRGAGGFGAAVGQRGAQGIRGRAEGAAAVTPPRG